MTTSKTPNIKTLDEILADMADAVSADASDTPKNKTTSKSATAHSNIKQPTSPSGVAPVKPSSAPNKKKPHNAESSAIATLLGDTHQSVLDDNTLKVLSQVRIEKLSVPDRDTRYLRWLAFYYLSKKELSRHQLRDKLIAKGCDPAAVDALLHEFAKKGYQSDERCATMMVREAVRKGRGIRYIAQSLRKAGLDAKDFGGMNALICLADTSSVSDGTILESDDESDDIDWLKLAVEARSKKYGKHLPKDPKDKARQLRFLQYRGFEAAVCFEALKMTPDDFDDA